ncbi:HYR domain-containing protein [Paraflavisolibacter sp. H34]|uniref:HYR domain-containing protein n=1 Tax=Huijunlia imazamoxiresistens TaxID=3127457 RepID=UPI003019761E
MLLLSAAPADAQLSFTNPAPIPLPDGTLTPIPASLYPSRLEVSGLQGVVTGLTLTLHGFEHNNPDALDLLLVAPDGTNAIVLSDIGGADDVLGIDLSLDDAAPAALPDFLPFGSGTYKPSNYGTPADVWPAPAAGPFRKGSLASFYGILPNGTWSLYAVNDTKGNFGTIARGWSLKVHTTLGAETVKISNFKGAYQKETGRATLSWTTELENYIKAISVQKSLNDAAWTTMTTLPSDSSTARGRTIEVVDTAVSFGTAQYRLFIEGKDQSTRYSDTITVTLADQEPPVLTVPAAITTSTDAGAATASVDPGTPSATDNSNGAVTVMATRSDAVALDAPYPMGRTTITWTATDASGNSVSGLQTIDVVDSEAPVISNLVPSSATLWPPNHKMHDIRLNYTASDNVAVTATKVTVTSNEALNGWGDGNTSADWQVISPTLVRLRAERSGLESGRVYTITVTSVDASGNTTSRSAAVSVDHDQSSGAGNPGSLYANVVTRPQSNSFTLTVKGNGSTEQVQLQVVDALSGRVIESRSCPAAGELQFGSSYGRGVYYVQVSQGNDKVVLKCAK